MDIDGKKWVKFVAMQQDCAILIYDLNTMKGTVESYHKTMAQQFKIVQLQAWKIAPSSISLKEKKKTTVLRHLRKERENQTADMAPRLLLETEPFCPLQTFEWQSQVYVMFICSFTRMISPSLKCQPSFRA